MSVIYTPTARPAAANNLPKTATERATALLEMATRLADLIRSEMAAIERGDLRAAAAMVAPKQKLVYGYEELGRQLRVDQAGFAALDDSVKTRLTAASRTIFDLTEQTVRKLRVRSEAQQGLVDFFVRAINTGRQIDGRYATYRGKATTAPPPRLPPVAMSYNAHC